MPTNTSRIPEDRRIYLLADHLDAILAAGEDLKCLFHCCAATSFSVKDPNSLGLEAFVAKARKLEFAAMGRIKLARIYAEEIARRDDSLGSLAQLFASATQIVVDAIDEICDSESHAFRNGFDPLVYLRGRGLIAEQAGCLSVVKRIAIDDSFLIAERIELGALLDMCAKFLDFLDRQFDLFPSALPSLPALPAPQPPQSNSAVATKDLTWKTMIGFSSAPLRT